MIQLITFLLIILLPIFVPYIVGLLFREYCNKYIGINVQKNDQMLIWLMGVTIILFISVMTGINIIIWHAAGSITN
jgi:hypothetical protein